MRGTKKLFTVFICAGFIALMPCFGTNALATPVPDTGQTKCYDDSGEIPCPSPGGLFYGQDSQYSTNPQSYTKLDSNGNALPDSASTWAMVRDNVTGLIWEMKNTKNGIKNYSNSHDADNTYTWYDSNQNTNGGYSGTPGNGTDTEDFIYILNNAHFGGFSDWHLPTIKELSTLIDSSRSSPGPTINTAYFPDAVAAYYWSSTTYAHDPVRAWCVYSSIGTVPSGLIKSSGNYVRAVRGGQSTNNFIDNGDGTVTDTGTGLMWQQDPAPGTYTWQEALSYCENLPLAGHHDWRLPNRNELQSLVDYSRYNLAINATFFSDNSTYQPIYWSSTTYADSPYGAWIVYFDYGIVGGFPKYVDSYVRAVRDGINILHPTNRIPNSNLINLPLDGQLKVLSGAGVDQSKPTVVITHGWNLPGNDPNWIQSMADSMMNKGINANIVWWDWLEQATSLSLGKPASNAPSQGTALAKELYNTLGTNYNQSIHFIGHSLGTIVNKEAVNYLHEKGWNPNKTQVTILDAPEEMVLEFKSWGNCIPRQAAWIDNYITAFGDIHSEAANVILLQNMPVTVSSTLIELIHSFSDFHGYAYNWYNQSIDNPQGSTVGFRWSFEWDGLDGSPGQGSYFVQTVNPSDSELTLEGSTSSNAQTALNTRKAIFSVEAASLSFDNIINPVNVAGNVAIELIEKLEQGIIKLIPRLKFTEESPAYAWIPVKIPVNTAYMSFDFLVENAGDGDYLSAGISDEPLFMLELKYVEGQGLNNSGLLDVSQYAGQDVELFFGLNSVGEKNAKFNIEGIKFYDNSYNPTLIKLSSFTATPGANRIILKWVTESEISNAGFNLYRSDSEGGEYAKINGSLISAKGSATQGASYEFIDTDVQNRKTYYYKLEDIDLNGTSTMHGPVSAMPRRIYGLK